MSRQPIPIPFAEWMPDASDISGMALDAKGVISQAMRYAPLHGLTPYKAGAGIAGRCIGGRGFWSSAGVPAIFLADEIDLYRVMARQPTVVSQAGGYVVDGTSGWQFEQFGDFVVAVNGNVDPQVFDLTSSSAFADLGGNPPLSTAVWRVSNQLCLANGRTLSVSGFNDVTNWNYETATQGVQVDVDQLGGNIQTGVGGEVGLIFQERGIIRMTYVGPPTVFQLSTIEWRHGAISRDAVSPYGRQVFYVSETGFHVTDGLSSTPIGANKVDKWFADNLNYSARNRVSCAVDFARKLWLIAFPTGGNVWPDHLLIYSMADNRWTHDEIETQHILEMPREVVSVDDADAIIAIAGSDVVDDITLSVDDPIWRETRTQVAAVSDAGVLSTFEGDTRPATLTTTEFEPSPLKQTLIDEVWPVIDVADVADVTVTTGTKGPHQGATLATSSAAMNVHGFAPMRVGGRFARVTMDVAEAANWSEATAVTWRGSAAGER
jgi:hypothetical protein